MLLNLLYAALFAAITIYLHQLKMQIMKLGINPNFDCKTRTAMEVAVKSRRIKSGTLALIGWDVAGMGKANSIHGEDWVNTRVKTSLALVSAMCRAEDVIGQLNSGDEFVMLVPIEDAAQLIEKIKYIFGLNPVAQSGESIYISYVEYDTTLPFSGPSSNATKVMEKVYQLKKEMKK